MLRLRTFGGAALLEDERVLGGTAAQKRRLALLALLAAAGDRGMSRDKLASLLWPESDQERARHSLSQWLFTTRRDLKAEDLFLGTTELRLNRERISSDVAEFERAVQAGDLEAAEACYAGPFLDGFHLTGASEFGRWADTERARLAACHERTLESMAVQRTAAGDNRGALELWRRLAAADPYNGRTALALMRAFDAAGDVAGALTHARVHATLLREELGAEPQPEVLAYAEQLRTASARGAGRQSRPAEPAGGDAFTSAAEPTAVATLPGPAPATESGRSSPQPSTVRSTATEGAPPPGAPPATPPTSTVPFSFARTRRRRRLLRRSAFAGVGLLVVLAVAWTAVPVEARARIRTLIDRGDARVLSNRIVVAPFEDFTGDPQLARFGEYASYVVTGELASARVFEVVDEKTSYMNGRVVDAIPRLFRDDNRAIALAKETEAGLLVSGSYSRERDSIRIQVQLTDVAADRFIGTHKVAGALHEKARLMDDLARRVVAMAAVTVDTSVTGIPVRRTNPPSFDSYAETVRAWDRYARGDIEGFYRHARRAAEKDSMYMMPVLMQAYMRSDAREWAAADSLVRVLEQHLGRESGRVSPIEDAGTEMLRAAVRGDMAGHLRGALAVRDASPGSAEVRTYAARVAVNANQPRLALAIISEVDPSRGMMLAAPWYWNWASAAYHLLADHEKERAHAREGMERFPSAETAVANHGRALAVTGDGDELHKLLGRLPRPGEANAHRRWKIAIDWARELRAHGHPSESRRLLESLLRELNGPLALRNPASDRFRATVLGDLGRSADAYRLWTQLVARSPESLEALGNLGVAAARVGNRAKAQEVEQLIAGTTWPYAHGRDAMWQARISAALGDTGRAETMVEMALTRGYPRFFDPAGGLYDEPEIHADPALQPLRRLESFRKLLAPKG